jgi:hypothetical protein
VKNSTDVGRVMWNVRGRRGFRRGGRSSRERSRRCSAGRQLNGYLKCWAFDAKKSKSVCGGEKRKGKARKTESSASPADPHLPKSREHKASYLCIVIIKVYI